MESWKDISFSYILPCGNKTFVIFNLRPIGQESSLSCGIHLRDSFAQQHRDSSLRKENAINLSSVDELFTFPLSLNSSTGR